MTVSFDMSNSVHDYVIPELVFFITSWVILPFNVARPFLFMDSDIA